MYMKIKEGGENHGKIACLVPIAILVLIISAEVKRNKLAKRNKVAKTEDNKKEELSN